MSKLVKLDIIIESVKLNDLIDIFEKDKIPGYTIIGNISGRGENGVLDHNCKAKIFENSYLFVICDDEIANVLIDKLYAILKDFSGACFVSEVSRMEFYHRNNKT